jgi:hypothetical protein
MAPRYSIATKKAPNPTDKHVGSRVRMRRKMLAMNQTVVLAPLRRGFLAPVDANLFDNLDSAKTPKERVYSPSRKREELPMSEDALRGWYWAGVIVSAVVLWVIWYMVV